MDDLKSKSIYNEESINELIQNLSEHLKFKQSNNTSRCNLSSSLNQDKTYSPYSYSPEDLDHNNSLSSTTSDYLIQQQQNQSKNVDMETYFLMQNLLKRGELINEAVRRLNNVKQQNKQTNLITKQY